MLRAPARSGTPRCAFLCEHLLARIRLQKQVSRKLLVRICLRESAYKNLLARIFCKDLLAIICDAVLASLLADQSMNITK